MKKVISLVLVLALAGFAQANVITIGTGADYDFDTIQAGIDAANGGDTVLVAPGEYVITEPITFRGKAITVRSEAGRDETTIRMGTPADTNRGSVVIFENNETAESVLEGFTITGGRGSLVLSLNEWPGGGILFDASSGTVKNCTIVQNSVEDNGGGIFCAYPCSPSLIDCIIADNLAGRAGGGVLTRSGATMTLTDCIIKGNSSEKSTDSGGGGVFCGLDSSMTMTGCTITENSAGDSGGGVFAWTRSSLTLTNCVIRENSARLGGGWGGAGGGVNCWLNSSMTMTNCTIIGNVARVFGGVLYGDNSSVTMTHCAIVGNTGAEWCGGLGGYLPASAPTSVINCTICGNSSGLYPGGGLACYDGASATVTNSIIWGNTAPKGREVYLQQSPTTFRITYSNVAGGQTGVTVEGGSTLNWGEGNIGADPLFTEPGYWADINDPNIMVEPDDLNAVWTAGDYHLKSEAGRWDPISESWVIDDVTSPCIDRGDPHSPVGDEPDPNGGIINMGAYGGTPEASMSIGQLPPILLALWRLDGTEGDIAYESVGNNHGTLNGNPTWQPLDGKVGGALQFDGIDDYVNTPFVLNPGEVSFSVTAWICGGAPGQVIISQADADEQGPVESGSTWLGINPSNGGLMTGLMDIFFGPLESESVVADEQWHNVGLVYDFTTMKRHLYVDGAEVAVDSGFVGGVQSTAGHYFGAGQTLDAASFFSGLIDDIRIYNRAVSP